MLRFYSLFLFLLVFLTSRATFAIDCNDLDTNQKIRSFLTQVKASNPLFRNDLSAQIVLDPCENELCKKKNSQLREKKKELIYSLRVNNNKRLFFVKGPNAPQCIVELGAQQFLCSQCNWTTNDQCRRFHVSESTSTLRGTNIDRADFEIFYHENYESHCFGLEKQPDHIKIVTLKTKGEAPYDKIIGFYHKEKKVPVTVNFFVGTTLRKVYRFYPKYYTQLAGEWISTAARIRTTQGNENSYIFETLINVVKDKNQNYFLYLDLKKDPQLKNANYDFLFNTN
ncbi:hypothetical protein WDW89_19995 [Deltaproteobacteria bacterium TL4]